MKKLITILAVFLTTSFILPGCGEPSFCDCNDRYGSLSDSDKEKCDKMADKLSQEELTRKMQDCH